MALRAVGAWNVFDAVEMFDDAGVARLQAYAGGADSPIPGFWSESDIEQFEDFSSRSAR